MTIEHYRFRPGMRLEMDQDPMSQAQKVMEANPQLRKPLVPGEYDMTPEVWTQHGSNRYKYNLIVYENGTGTLRLIPVDQESVAIVISPEGADAKAGGRTIRIPQDASTMPIAGPKRGDVTLRVYDDIINFTPGPSPKAEPSEGSK